MGLFDDITGGLSDIAGKAADIGKKAAREAKVFAGGANQVIGAPTVNTVKGAFSGDPGDIAKVGVAAAAVIPAERGLRAIGFAREAKGLPMGERIGLGMRAAMESSPLFHGTTSAAAEAIRAGGFSGSAASEGERALHGGFPGKTYVSTSARTAAKYARSSSILSGDKAARPAIVLARKVGEPIATRQWPGKLGTEMEFKAPDVKAVTPFPDTMANVARRVKGKVMGVISAQGEASLAERIAATKDEIVRIGGTPPTGPFTGVTKTKLSLLQGELADMPRRAEGAAEVKSKFDSGRISDFAKKAAQKALKGREQGALKLPGLRELESGEVKASTYAGRNYAQTQRASSPESRLLSLRGAESVRSFNETAMGAYGKSLAAMKTMAKTHAMRLPRN